MNFIEKKAIRMAKIFAVMALDLCLCVTTVWLAFYLRLGEVIDLTGRVGWEPKYAVFGAVIISVPIFILSGFYQMIFRHSGGRALGTAVLAMTLYGTIYAATFTIYGIEGVPRTIGIIQPILLLFGVGASRLLARYWLAGSEARVLFRPRTGSKVLIYGAGEAGRQLAAGLSNTVGSRVIGFLDDDVHLHGRIINGFRVYNPDQLQEVVPKLAVSGVLLALPSISRTRRNQILRKILDAKVYVRTLPSLSDLVEGKVTVTDLTDLALDDLLPREPHEPNKSLLTNKVTNKVVMVTGAGGSIGSELCRQVATLNPSLVLLCEQNEYALYLLHQDLTFKYPKIADRFVPLLCSVKDARRMNEIMVAWNPSTVYHVAAYKHVPLVELNPVEGILNNTFGTLTTAVTAVKAGVSDFVLISTDKAVRPTNIMGASKRLAEVILQAIANEVAIDGVPRKTKFSMVRFGNVLGSSGSVVPKFREQIKSGGPITLTDPEITRYFMTITEAAQLVIQAGAMAQGGDVFVLDMHEPIKIQDLAIRMIKLSGLTLRDENNPNGDIAIAITGLRDGEKLFEELLIGNNPQTTTHPGIMKATEEFLKWIDLQPKLMQLQGALSVNDVQSVRTLMEELVTGYVPHKTIVDLVFLASDAERSELAAKEIKGVKVNNPMVNP
jgi:FlaA1/EpsC-like NDP-sugar epimerase